MTAIPVIEINNPQARASVSLQGGQVLSYQPAGQAPVLWTSRKSAFLPGKAIRGGIPVCWPWFGPHPEDPAKPAHGFARTALWASRGARRLENGSTELRLTLADDAATRARWPHAFQLEMTVAVGKELRVELAVRNGGREDFTCGGALHSYFTVSDVTKVRLLGLEGRDYIDQLDPARPKRQEGPIAVSGETDRVYLDTEDECVIEDPGLKRRVRIAKSGSRTTVVWNPWVEKSKRMADFGDDEYPGMLCVETANALDDRVRVPPGGEHRLSAFIRAEPL